MLGSDSFQHAGEVKGIQHLAPEPFRTFLENLSLVHPLVKNYNSKIKTNHNFITGNIS